MLLHQKNLSTLFLLVCLSKASYAQQEFQSQNTNNLSSPCFFVHTVDFDTINNNKTMDTSQLNSTLSAIAFSKENQKQYLNKCLDADDIQNIATNTQNKLIDAGFVTTKVLVRDQELGDGKLTLSLAMGSLGQILADTKHSKKDVYNTQIKKLNKNLPLPFVFGTATTIKSGDILNIRSLETTLENLKKVPSSDARFEIMPSSSGMPGESDILIHYSQDRNVRGSLSLDDSGGTSTGKYQANANLFFDNPSNTNDLFHISYSHSFDYFNKKDRWDDKNNSNNYSISYAIPFDNTAFNISHSLYNYKQNVIGVNQTYRYGGNSQNSALNISHLVNRDKNSKTYLTGGGFIKNQKNFIDNTEIEVQRRKIAGWRLGIKHEYAKNNSKKSVYIDYQRGTGAFDAITPSEKLFNEGDSRVGIITFGLDHNRPFVFGKKANAYSVDYNASLKAQYALDALVPSERMSIGGRYSVRGFDGERTLSADNGILFKQNVSFPLTFINQRHSLVVGLDTGYVRMKNKTQDQLLLGHTLTGASVGLKGQIHNPLYKYQHLTYDIFAGHAISAPKGFYGGGSQGDYKKNRPVYGFSVSLGF